MKRSLAGIVFIFFFCEMALALKDATVIEKFEKLGFKCAEKNKMVRCFGQIEHYSMPVNFYFHNEPIVSSEMSLFVHFHGWWLDPKDSPIEGSNGDFSQFLSESSASAVLLIPESRGRNETYSNDLGELWKSQRFFANVRSVLERVGLLTGENVVTKISAHSGAYVYLGQLGDWIHSEQIPLFRNLNGVALLDSAYGYRSGLVNIARNLCKPLSSIYLLALNPADGRNDKLTTNERIFTELSQFQDCKGLQLLLLKNRTAEHVEFPKIYLAAFWSQRY